MPASKDLLSKLQSHGCLCELITRDLLGRLFCIQQFKSLVKEQPQTISSLDQITALYLRNNEPHMKFVKGKRQRLSVVFKRRTMAEKNDHPLSSSKLRSSQSNPDRHAGSIVEELSYSEEESDGAEDLIYPDLNPRAAMSAKLALASMIPNTFTSLPPIRDLLNTQSSKVQDETIQECLPYLSGSEEGLKYNGYGVPRLDRSRHIQFLHKSLRKLPAPYVAADASRPWFFYWVLGGLATMGEDPTKYRKSLISTVRPIQNEGGGFGGGNGQMSHLAPTYAIVLALAIVGGDEALDLIDRKAMWQWLGALKQPDGGFQMAIGGEEDIRYVPMK